LERSANQQSGGNGGGVNDSAPIASAPPEYLVSRVKRARRQSGNAVA
jgi:hypothetical protein